MADTNLLVLAREYKKLREEVKKVLSMPKGDKGDQGEKGEKGDTGDTGPQGFPGRDGKDGINGYDGKDGRDGIDGKNGKDGLDGVGVANAYIDFDNSLVIVLTDGNEINAGYLSQETKDSVIANFKQGAQTLNELLPSQAGNANKFLKTDGENVSWDTLDGSDINLASPPVIGDTTPNAATFTTVNIPGEAGTATLTKNTSITSWLYSGKSFSIAGQETAPTGLFFSSDGTKMYVNGTTGDDVNEYTLSTAWDVTTATFVTVFSTAAQDTAPADLFFNPDGLSMYVVGDTNNTVFQYTLGTAWSVATASYASKSFSVGSQDTTPAGIWFKPDGTVMYMVGSLTDAVYQYTLGTAWDVSTAVYASKTYSVAAQDTAPTQVNLSADGAKMWVLGQIGDDIWEYTLGTAWDVSTATPVNNFYVGFQDVTPTGLFIDSSAANRVFIVGSTNDTVYQYNTATNSVDFNTDKFYTPGALSVNGNFVAGANAYVDGSLTVQGGVTVGGTGAFNGLSSSGTSSLATSTSSQTASFAAGATTSGSTKTVNIGTAGLSGSTTAINIGSSVSGSLGTTTISAPTVNIGQTATQFSVTNTASAVNYVQVTGNATNGAPTIMAQGSDANVFLDIKSKGSNQISLYTGGGIQFAAIHAASAVNYTTAKGAAAGAAPAFGVVGSDTNIDLALTPKGTGLVRFGTRTASADAPITGYIEIKDSGGTTRRLAVIG